MRKILKIKQILFLLPILVLNLQAEPLVSDNRIAYYQLQEHVRNGLYNTHTHTIESFTAKVIKSIEEGITDQELSVLLQNLAQELGEKHALYNYCIYDVAFRTRFMHKKPYPNVNVDDYGLVVLSVLDTLLDSKTDELKTLIDLILDTETDKAERFVPGQETDSSLDAWIKENKNMTIDESAKSFQAIAKRSFAERDRADILRYLVIDFIRDSKDMTLEERKESLVGLVKKMLSKKEARIFLSMVGITKNTFSSDTIRFLLESPVRSRALCFLSNVVKEYIRDPETHADSTSIQISDMQSQT